MCLFMRLTVIPTAMAAVPKMAGGPRHTLADGRRQFNDGHPRKGNQIDWDGFPRPYLIHYGTAAC